MIAKIGRGKNLFGVLSYNEQKVDKENGALLYAHKMPIPLVDETHKVSLMARFFEPWLAVNRNTEKPILHISLNPDPKDELSDERLKELAEQYMQAMGYGNQPFIVYKHTDIERTHIHIVSVCVDEEGKKIDDSFERKRSMDVCRTLEKAFNLLPASKKANTQNNLLLHPVDYKKNDLKSQLAAVVRYLPGMYSFQTLGEYNALLSLFNITAEKVEGIAPREGLVYFALNEKGEKACNPFKSSLFGKKAGLAALNNRMVTTKEVRKNNTAKASLIKTIDGVLKNSSNEKDFKQGLAEKGIHLVVRRNDTGRIYGITFIDHNSRSVYNGSHLSKQLSANAFHAWWNEGKEKPMVLDNESTKPTKTILSEKPAITTFEPLVSSAQNDFNIDGVGGLFNFLLTEAQSNDYEEPAFENRMKKKKRRQQRQNKG